MLAGTKTLEIRDKPFRAQHVWLGYKELIFGRAYIDGAKRIATDDEWRRLLPQHRWETAVRPYKTTYCLQLSQVSRVRRPHKYKHPHGAIGVVVYREDTCTIASKAVGKKQILCCDRPESCRFHRDGNGKAAWACIFCDATALREVHRVAPGTITRALNNLKAKCP